MIALWPDGKFTITENGCFAKTFGLSEKTEPVIFRGTVNKDAWVENVFIKEDGTFDFVKIRLNLEDVKRLKEMLITTGASRENIDKYLNSEVKAEDVLDGFDIPKDNWDFVVWTMNGRSIIPMKAIKNAADFNNLPVLGSLGILNRDEGKDAATPGIVLFKSPEQAAGYFMLGETSKTSAAGKERGKTRSPFTQPFFPRSHDLQPVRFRELAGKFSNMQTWLMNTGYIGGDSNDEKDGNALKVKIKHSSAMLEALFAGNIKWKKDPDYHYFIVDIDAPDNSELIRKVPVEILNPEIFYKKNNRIDEYRDHINKMMIERKKFLEKFKVDPVIIKEVVF